MTADTEVFQSGEQPAPAAVSPLEVIRFAHRRQDTQILLATVSGIVTTNPVMIEWVSRHTPVTIITTKTIQIQENRGNREPILTEPEPGCFGNAVGLKNPGLAATREELATLREKISRSDRTLPELNVSIAGKDAEEFSRLARELAPVADLLELNLSCPHAHGGYGALIGCDPDLVEQCVRAAVEAADGTPVFAKLTPNLPAEHGIGAIARCAFEAGATGITAINTVGPCRYREPETGAVILNNPGDSRSRTPSGMGGQSGRWVRERALRCIADIRSALGPAVPIIGMGGVERPADARAMRYAGADVVGVGSALALVHQKEWPAMLEAMQQPEPGTTTSALGQASQRTRVTDRAPTAERASTTPRALDPTGATAGAAPGPTTPRALDPTGATNGAGPGPTTPRALDPTGATNGAGPVRSVRYRDDAGMRFSRRTVLERRELGGGLFELSLNGTLRFDPGQTCFLWLPGVGEKPFSPALSNPATFLVRRRGPVTEALGNLSPGDNLFLRGPYGAGFGVIAGAAVQPAPDAAPPSHGTALILAAGSGAAAVPRLAEALRERLAEGSPPPPALGQHPNGPQAAVGQHPNGLWAALGQHPNGLWAALGQHPDRPRAVGCREVPAKTSTKDSPRRRGAPVEVWIGLRDGVHTVPLEAAIRQHAVLRVVHDRGVTGRVLSVAEREGTAPIGSLWAIGPDPFMQAAVAVGFSLGLSAQRMRISLEKEMLCGVGLCGMCHNHGYLTCQFGTFAEVHP